MYDKQTILCEKYALIPQTDLICLDISFDNFESFGYSTCSSGVWNPLRDIKFIFMKLINLDYLSVTPRGKY